MYRNQFWQPIAFFLATVAGSSALAATPPNVVMTFVHPERFTDFRVQGRNEWDSAAKFAREMSSALALTVAKQAPGCTLAFRFTDIDLGGRYEPRLVRRFNDVRFYHNGREPVRLYFDYTLADPRGRVLASGSDSATDVLYLGRYPSEPVRLPFEEFFFEKQALMSWIRTKINALETSPTLAEKR
jgi:Protein of unknown function (DUF3016)